MKAQVDRCLELRTGHCRRNVDCETEPRRTPRTAPVISDRERSVVTFHCLVEGHRLARRVPRRDRQRNRPAVHRREHSFVQLALDSTLDKLQIVVHDARLVIVAITLAA
jgi:hypothetical protein